MRVTEGACFHTAFTEQTLRRKAIKCQPAAAHEELSFKTFAASLADATERAKTSQVPLPELLNAFKEL